MEPTRSYVLVRWAILRLLGVVYAFAFLGILVQGPALLGSRGLTPVADHVRHLELAGYGFWDVPSIFVLDPSDGALFAWGIVGLVLALALVAGYANLPSLLVLWVIYGSYERVGQLWFGFGWEIQLLETTLLAACLAHPWDPRPLRAPPPPAISLVLMRWLVFRIMLGAGLIKLRGSACWTELACLDWHFETQPIPNPLSPLFHHLPHALQAIGVLVNHVVELIFPFFVFGPRRLRLVAGIGMALFQVTLVLSGNLAFLNWLTLVPILACFDDGVVPARWRDRWLPTIEGRGLRGGEEEGVGQAKSGGRDEVKAFVWHRWNVHRAIVVAFACLVAIKSCHVVDNLLSSKQQMNTTFDRLALVNTYGAFGTVGDTRYELVIEGTLDPDPATATWSAYELPCKPGALDRRPCVLGPYHLRLDWLIWFAAFDERPSDRSAWMLHLVWKLLDGDVGIRERFAVDPFDGEAPAFVRVRRFRYHLEPYGSATWWSRDQESEWLAPVHLDSEGFAEVLAGRGWPSRTAK